MVTVNLPVVSGISTVSSPSGFSQKGIGQNSIVPDHTFYLHLKETEFRFNHRRDSLYQEILKLLRLKPL